MCWQILGRVCEEDQSILLILLDLGVAHQPNMKREGERERGRQGGREGGEGLHTKNTHLLSFPFSLLLFVSTSSYSLSLSFCQSLYKCPSFPLSVPYTPS